MICFVASSLMGGINYVSTVLNMRTKGMDLWKMPLSYLGVLLNSCIGCVIIPGIGCWYRVIDF